MRFGVLGPLEVWAAGGGQVRVPEAKVRALLAQLLARPGQVVGDGRLIEALWHGAPLPADPTASLQAKVSQLRRALDEAEPGARRMIVRRPPGYVLEADAATVDAGRFRALTAKARGLDDVRARSETLAEALGLWRGPAFAEFADELSVQGVAAELQEARLTAVEEHAEVRLELGEHGVLAGELTALVASHPLRERLRAAQMRALYRTGRSVEALDSYADLRRRLDEELGLVPGAPLEALQQAILRHDPGLSPKTPDDGASTARGRRTNLPTPADTLVGRESAVRTGTRLLDGSRLVTLTGPGGVGKTRLAVATGRELTGSLPDGVWLVELAGLGPAGRQAGTGGLARQIMAVLGIREEPEGPEDRSALGANGSEGHLTAALAARSLLLVLDNCEHVIDAMAELCGRLLAGTSGVKILVTSQEPLRIGGETVWSVPPLELPPTDGQSGPADLERSPAVRLFIDRAHAADPSFTLDATNATAVAAVCRRLDGIPLALELAATRVRALGVHELLARLDERFDVLNSGHRGAPHRHRTLQATVDWSWNLLTEQERSVLRRLAVHREGCSLSAAEDLCAGHDVAGEEVLDLLARLVDRSLVTLQQRGDSVRYRLLESVRIYAGQRLAASDEGDDVDRWHTVYYTALAERARPRLHDAGQRRLLSTLDAESANLRDGLERACRTGDAAGALRLVNSLAWYWFLAGRLGEGRRALADALAACGDAPVAARAEAEAWLRGFDLLLGRGTPSAPATGPDRPSVDVVTARTVGLARAEWFLGFALWDVGALDACEAQNDRALADFRALDDSWGVAAALGTRAALDMARSDLESLHADALEARDRFVELGDVWGQLKTTEMLGTYAEVNADYEAAARLHQEALRMAQSLEMRSEQSRHLTGLGRVALLSRRHDEARAYHRRALRLAVEQGNRPAEQMAELGLALGARREGDLAAAEAHLRPWLRWNRSRDAHNGLALVLAELGFVAELRGSAATALTLHRSGLAAARATGDPRAVALALEGLAGAHALADRPARAARLLGAADTARLRSGAPLPEAERGDVDRVAARARKALGDAAYTAAYETGRALDLHAAAAVEDPEPPPDAVPERSGIEKPRPGPRA
jgi:predicted ATPase/DNA-binding SARP family transcriptional activator